MKKILFCTLNSKYIHSSLAPWYLCSAVEQFCSCPVEADVIEATVNESVDVITSRIIEAHPDFLGFSVYIWNRTKTFDIIKIGNVKKRGVKGEKHTCNLKCKNCNYCFNPKPIFCPCPHC